MVLAAKCKDHFPPPPHHRLMDTTRACEALLRLKGRTTQGLYFPKGLPKDGIVIIKMMVGSQDPEVQRVRASTHYFRGSAFIAKGPYRAIGTYFEKNVRNAST